MTSTLVSWVNEWFYHPGTEQTPSDDRLYCYNATVALIGEHLGSIPARKVQRNLHDYLTYLLLGWNPITAWPKESAFDRVERSESERTLDSTIESIKKLLDFSGKSKPSMFPLLTCLMAMNDQHEAIAAPFFTGEKITMLTLALWLLDRTTSFPIHDLGLVRALLDLYYRSDMVATEEVSIEYARTNHDVHYCSWFNHQVDRLLTLNVEHDEFIRDLAYIGWFISLIRSSRMLRSRSRNTEWKNEVVELLNDEVSKMRTALESAALRCVEDQIRNGSCLNASKLFGLFKIKPPKVKILPIKS